MKSTFAFSILTLTLLFAIPGTLHAQDYTLTYSPKKFASKHFQLNVEMTAPAIGAVSQPVATTVPVCTDNDCQSFCQVSVRFPSGRAAASVMDLDLKTVEQNALNLEYVLSEQFEGACGAAIPSLSRFNGFASTGVMGFDFGKSYNSVVLYAQGPQFKVVQNSDGSYQITEMIFDNQLNGTLSYYDGGHEFDLSNIINGQIKPLN